MVRSVQTFVVRVFRSARASPAEDGILRGVVDDIGSGSRTPFGDAEQLLQILGQAAPPALRPERHPGQDRSTSQPLARRSP
jgi:hypothetical protein